MWNTAAVVIRAFFFSDFKNINRLQHTSHVFFTFFQLVFCPHVVLRVRMGVSL